MYHMVQFEEIRVGLPDGYSAYARLWQPASPRGALLYHHGIQSHCGWYEASAGQLADGGYAVLQIDRRGSGRNQDARGHAESADQLTRDALAAGAELLRRTGLPAYHLLGVSWGGKLAVAAYVADPTAVLSLSLVTPGLFPRVGVSKADQARIGFSMLYEPMKPFDIPLGDAALFTAVVRWQEFIDADPLTLRQCTASFYLASRRLDKVVAKLPKAPAVPIHLLLAGNERIIYNGATAEFIRQLHWPKCRITHYRDARHALEFEDDRDVYFADLVAFIADV